jgi:hypothetical protein
MSRHRSDVDLDPAVAAELEALEAALADAPGADPVLTQLVRDVRAEAPSMPLALRERLDRDVAAGFPRERRRRLHLPTSIAGRVIPIVGAVAIAVAVVGINLANQTSTISSHSDSAVVARSSPLREPAPDAAAPEAAAGSTASTESAAVPPGKRKVEREVQLALRVDSGKLQDASDGVVATTQRFGGYVADSQVSARGRGGDASFTLRIPTAKLDAAIAQLSKLGHVAALDQSSKDITSAFTSVGDRLSDARAERKALVRALAKADTEGQIAALRERIRQNRSTLASLTAELKSLRTRADMATVDVTVRAPRHGAAAPTSDDGGWSPGDAAGDALRVLEVVASVVIVGAAVVLPVALLALLAALGARGLRRRRREHALDAG